MMVLHYLYVIMNYISCPQPFKLHGLVYYIRT